VCDNVAKKFTFAISSPDEFLLNLWGPYHLFAMGEAPHFTIGVQTDEY